MSNVIPSIESVIGFRATGVHADLKKDNKLDMALIVSDRDCMAGAVFTTNQVKAAPVLVSMEHFQKATSRMRGVAINTISANAGTGRVGVENSYTMAGFVAEPLGCQPEQIFVMSTGVIGTHLPMDKIDAGIKAAYDKLGQDWSKAAEGIMTTDTRPKIASVKVQTINGEYTIAGITKGSGMIAPNMATMLGILVTDAKLSAKQTQSSLKKACDLSYNRIVVDGDTSTNDMVVLLANGASGVGMESATDVAQFEQALTQLCTYLAQQVVRDGEGATKFITIEVTGAKSDADAAQIANTIAASPLVKTAFFGNDANVGRILMAAGRAGVDFDPEKLMLWMTTGEELVEGDRGLLLFQDGTKARYKEADATAIIREKSVYVSLDLDAGNGRALVWTCDFSHEYVSINADYRS
jgi:glutamate N-acetyltransferase / amino-acid N-acetyltransferase